MVQPGGLHYPVGELEAKGRRKTEDRWGIGQDSRGGNGSAVVCIERRWGAACGAVHCGVLGRASLRFGSELADGARKSKLLQTSPPAPLSFVSLRFGISLRRTTPCDHHSPLGMGWSVRSEKA